MAIVMNGVTVNTMSYGSNVPTTQVWLYDTVTGNNVVNNPSPPPSQLECQNISQFPVQNGNWS
jgi:hypothetical protein